VPISFLKSSYKGNSKNRIGNFYARTAISAPAQRTKAEEEALEAYSCQVLRDIRKEVKMTQYADTDR
jgi:hypothetical protein